MLIVVSHYRQEIEKEAGWKENLMSIGLGAATMFGTPGCSDKDQCPANQDPAKIQQVEQSEIVNPGYLDNLIYQYKESLDNGTISLKQFEEFVYSILGDEQHANYQSPNWSNWGNLKYKENKFKALTELTQRARQRAQQRINQQSWK